MILNFRYIVHFLLLKEYGGQLSKNNSALLITPAIDLNTKHQMNYVIENTK